MIKPGKTNFNKPSGSLTERLVDQSAQLMKQGHRIACIILKEGLYKQLAREMGIWNWWRMRVLLQIPGVSEVYLS